MTEGTACRLSPLPGSTHFGEYICYRCRASLISTPLQHPVCPTMNWESVPSSVPNTNSTHPPALPTRLRLNKVMPITRGPLDQCIKKIKNRFSGRDGSQCLTTPKEVQVRLTTPVALAPTSASATLSITSPRLRHTRTSSAPLAMQKDEEEHHLKADHCLPSFRTNRSWS